MVRFELLNSNGTIELNRFSIRAVHQHWGDVSLPPFEFPNGTRVDYGDKDEVYVKGTIIGVMRNITNSRP